jgi:hypothetical protein
LGSPPFWRKRHMRQKFHGVIVHNRVANGPNKC